MSVKQLTQSFCIFPGGFVALLFGLFCLSMQAATYYIDFEKGDDAAAGTSAATAFQHCPGDPQAKGLAGDTRLASGDTVLLKGGVTYFGNIVLSSSGAPGRPIVIDGNTAGTFGEGRAVIDGATVVKGW